MSLDAQWIESQIKLETDKLKRLEQLRQIAADPEMVRLLREAFADEHASEPRQSPPERSKPTTASQASEGTGAPLIVDSLVGATTDKVKRGTLTQAVRRKAESLPTSFTGYELTDLMQRDGFVFAAKDPPISVIDVLRKLVRKGIIDKAHQGSGSQPDRYIRKGALFAGQQDGGERFAA